MYYTNMYNTDTHMIMYICICIDLHVCINVYRHTCMNIYMYI